MPFRSIDHGINDLFACYGIIHPTRVEHWQPSKEAEDLSTPT